MFFLLILQNIKRLAFQLKGDVGFRFGCYSLEMKELIENS